MDFGLYYDSYLYHPYNPSGRSVRPMEPANSVSPVNKKSLKLKQEEP